MTDIGVQLFVVGMPAHKDLYKALNLDLKRCVSTSHDQ